MRTAIWVVLGIALAGCSTASTGTGSSTGSTGTIGGGGTTGTGATSGSSGSSGSSGTTGSVFSPESLEVYVGQQHLQGSASYAVYVYGLHSTTPCAATPYGPCQVFECSNTAPAKVELLNAGAVAVNGDVGAVNLTFVPDAGYPYTGQNNAEFFTSGATLTAQATGAAVPAFQLTCTGPSLVTVNAPAFSFTPGTLPANQDLTVTWTPGTSADVLVSASSVTPPDAGSYFGLVCQVPSTAGTLTVPAAALQRLAPELSLAVNGYCQTQTVEGGYGITLGVSELSVTPNGDGASGLFYVQ